MRLIGIGTVSGGAPSEGVTRIELATADFGTSKSARLRRAYEISPSEKLYTNLRLDMGRRNPKSVSKDII